MRPLALLVMCGCRIAFDPLLPDGPATDASLADSSLAGERPAVCAQAQIFEPFDATPFCTDGVTVEAPRLSQNASALAIQLPGDTAQYAGCTFFQNYRFTNNGVILHVLDVLSMPNGYTQFTVRNTFNEAPDLSAQMRVVDGRLQFALNGTIVQTRDHIASPEWWRIRRADNVSVEALVSNDGIAWDLFASATASLPASISVDIGAGVASAPTSAGTARFGTFGLCD